MLRLTLKLLALSAAVYGTLWAIPQVTSRGSVVDPNVQRLEAMAKVGEIDLLFLGSSYTYASVIPSRFDRLGLRSFNLGLPTASVEMYEVAYQDFLRNHSKPPATMLLNVSLMGCSPGADYWPRYPVHRYLSAPLSNEALVLQTGRFRQWPELVVNEARWSLTRLLKGGPVEEARSRMLETRGFVGSDVELNQKIYLTERSYYTGNVKYAFDTARSDRLLRFAERLRGDGVHTLFFEVPAKRLREFYSEAFQAAYESFLSRVRERGFVVLRSPLEFQDSDYRNIDHMNTRGAERYSDWLARELEATGVARH